MFKHELAHKFYTGEVGCDSWRTIFKEKGWTLVLRNNDKSSYQCRKWLDDEFADTWHTYNDRWFTFKNEEDAVHFKLVWN